MKFYRLIISHIFCVTVSSVICSENGPSCLAGGEIATGSEFPFMTFVYHKNIGCSGSIISEEWVLTAAHCFSVSRWFGMKANDVLLIAGLTNLAEAAGQTQVRRGTEVHLHPGYKVNTKPTHVADDDLALVRVEPFAMTSSVGTVRPSDKGFPISYYVQCTAVGWGEIDLPPGKQNTVLHKIKVVSSMSAKACPGLEPWERAKIVCLQNDNGKGLCHGDSGGPLICQDELYGIAHLLYKNNVTKQERKDFDRCGADGVTHTFMFVCPYLDWIHGYVSTVPKMPPSCFQSV